KVEELLATLNPDLIGVVLDRALRDQRTPVVLAAVKALGNLADVNSLRPGPQGEPPLVRALAYGDRRGQLAAVDSILRIPGPASTQIAARIVDILKGALLPEAAASTRPRVVVALADRSFRNDVSDALKTAGADPVPAATGRAALRRLKQRADIDAVVID